MKSPVYCLTLIFLVSVVRAAAPESPAGTAEAALEKSDPIVAGSEPVPQETAPAPKRVQILISSLPGGRAQRAYRGLVAATGGARPYTWSVRSGVLPAGLTLDAATGVITGSPEDSGQSTFTIQVTDSSSSPQSAVKELSLAVAAAPVPVQPTSASLPGTDLPTSFTTAPAEGGATAQDIPAPPMAGAFWFPVVPAPLQIKTATLPKGQMHAAYHSIPAAQGGTPPYA